MATGEYLNGLPQLSAGDEENLQLDDRGRVYTVLSKIVNNSGLADVQIHGEDGEPIGEEALDTSITPADERGVVTYLARALVDVGLDEIRVSLEADNLPGDIDVDDSAIGDEGTASQQSDSTIAATVIDRLTALVDTLNSGQADDEVRVDLAADTLSGDVDVDDSAVGDETAASQQSDSTLAATVIERLTALVDVLNSGQADDEVRVDLAADTLANDLDVNLNSENVSPLGVENRSILGTQNDISLSNGGTTSVTLSASGAHSLAFAADGGSDYSVDVEWQDGNGTAVVTQADVVSNTGGGVTTFDTRSKSSQAVVTLTNDSGGTATYSLSAYFA